MHRAARTFGLLQDEVSMAWVRAGDLAALSRRFSDPSLTRPFFRQELLLRAFWRLLAWLARGKLPVERFDVAFPRPPYAGSYGKIFPAPPQFEQQRSGFWIAADLLPRPIRRDKAALRVFLADARSKLIVPRRDGLISDRVREHLQRVQPAWPDLGAAADALSTIARE